MKKAILAVSFGTSCEEAERSCIRPVEDALRRAFPDWEVRRAFTSRMILKKLKNRGIASENEIEALERLRAEGFESIAVAPTHIIPGQEYEVVAHGAQGLKVSEPLLAGDEDLVWMADLLSKIAAEEGGKLLLMGHGTEHAADATYERLRQKLPKNVYLACVEGSHTLGEILPELEQMEDRKIALMPLMLVAGDHARNDMAGDEEDSWKSILTAHGFDVRVRMQGLGALEAVQQKFVEKVRRIVE